MKRFESPVTEHRIDSFPLMACEARIQYFLRSMASIDTHKEKVGAFPVIFIYELEAWLSRQKRSAAQLQFKGPLAAQLQALGDVRRHGLAPVINQLHLSHQRHLRSGREWRRLCVGGSFPQLVEKLQGLLTPIRQPQDTKKVERPPKNSTWLKASGNCALSPSNTHGPCGSQRSAGKNQASLAATASA